VWLMRFCDFFINCTQYAVAHSCFLLVVYGMAFETFGPYSLLVFASPILRFLLCHRINAKNDHFFLNWIIAESILPWLILIILRPVLQDPLMIAGLSVTVSLLVLMLALFFLKCGPGTAASILVVMIIELFCLELQAFEFEYALIMFNNVAWGNREVKSDKASSVLDIKCRTDPKEKTWAGSSPPNFKKTLGCTFMTLIPYIHRIAIVLLILFKVVPINIAAFSIAACWLLTVPVCCFELLLSPKDSKQERSYKAGSAIEVPKSAMFDQVILGSDVPKSTLFDQINFGSTDQL